MNRRPPSSRRPAARASLLLCIAGALILAALAAPPASWAGTGGPGGARAKLSARRIFVAPDGSDRGSGSLRHPLATIQQAIDRARRGAVIEVRGGDYGQRIAFRHVADVTLRPYRDEHVILDGTHLPVPAGMSGMVLIDDSRRITVEGLEITGYRTTSMQSTPIGIYVHGGDTGVVLRDDHVHDMGNDNRTQGNFDTNALGIAVYGDSARHPIRRLTIADDTVDHMRTGASETVTLNGNVTGWRVVGNVIEDDNNIGIDAIGYEPTLSGRYRYTDRNRARHGLIADNVIRHILSSENPAYRLRWHGRAFWCDCADGIYVDGGTHIVIERNSVEEADIGIEVASEHPRGAADHIDVRDNVVSDSRATGISTGGYCDDHTDCGGGGLARPGPPVQTGQAFDNAFVNNTLYDNNTLHDGGPQFLIQYYTHDTLVENNIIVAGPGQRALLGTVPRAAADGRNRGNVVDHNLYDTTSGDPGGATFGWLGRTYPSWSGYRARTGEDAHGMFTAPGFVSRARRNLHLAPGSPALDAGAPLPPALVGRFDIDHQPRVQGGAIDLGADEFSAAAAGWLPGCGVFPCPPAS